MQLRCRRVLLSIVLLTGTSTVLAADDFGEESEAVFVRAREGVQGFDERVFLVRGGLEVHGQDWEISADEATISGALGAPERIQVTGAPARIVVTRGVGQAPIEGQSRSFDFEPPQNTVRFEGGAVVLDGTQSVSSESITYQLDREVFSAGRAGRVKVITSLPRGE